MNELKFDLPRDRFVPIEEIDVRLELQPHPFQLRNADAIEASWQLEQAANPALFDGEMVMLSGLKLEGTRLSGACRPVRYATMLYWRKNKGDGDVEHCFAMPALVTRDDALLAIRMARHTANPGKVYFAAGSFEPSDSMDGRMDIEGNMAREVREETGLDLSAGRREPVAQVFSTANATGMFRRYYLNEDTDTLAEKVRAHVAAEVDSEIDGPVIIRANDPMPDGTSLHMAAFVDWHFGRRS